MEQSQELSYRSQFKPGDVVTNPSTRLVYLVIAVETNKQVTISGTGVFLLYNDPPKIDWFYAPAFKRVFDI